MKTVLLFCLGVITLFADTIGGVDYTLPNATQYWQLKNQTEDGNSVTFLYVPKGIINPTEFFAASSTPQILDVSDLSSIQNSLKKLYPNITVDVKSLESKKGDHLYEWSGKMQGAETMHGWGRAINTEDGTVLFTYQSQDVSNVNALRDKWLPVLKNAKFNRTPADNLKKAI